MKIATKELDKAELFDQLQTPIVCITSSGKLFELNQAAVELFNIPDKYIRLKPFVALLYEQSARVFNTFLHDLSINIRDECEVQILTRNGPIIPVRLRGKVVFDKHNHISYVILCIYDISAQKQIENNLLRAQSEMEHLAHHDSLTGLPNRYLLEDRLEHAMTRTKRNGWLGALIFLDIDRFKIINDDHGHHTGDEVLKEVSSRLLSNVREQDTVCRYSGDEFIIILEEITCKDDAEYVVKKILQCFEQDATGIIDQPLRISTSIGICLFDKYDTDAEALIKKADFAMYESKRNGRNGYTFYTAEQLIHQNLEDIIENDLNLALLQSQFKLYFQPQYDCRNETICGVEALSKWHHPTRGIIQPTDFIHRMENSHLSYQLTEWVLREACSTAYDWLGQGKKFGRISVNIGPKDFGSAKLIDLVKTVLTDTGLPPENLEIELTETSLLQNPELAKKLLHELQSMGIYLTLDDFGTGYSALSYLNEYPFNCIKIDKSFVDKLPFNKKSSALVDAMISIADSINIDIIAEGVEQENQRDYLQSRGCYVMQGYLYKGAIPADNIEPLFEQGNKATVFSINKN